jgi:hypothetical protein
VHTVDADLSPPPQPQVTEKKQPEAEPDLDLPSQAQERKPEVVAEKPRGDSGEVYVLSAEMYGEIFVNGKSYGFPPLLARDVAPGAATVELKIDGATRRTMTVQVGSHRRVTARIR